MVTDGLQTRLCWVDSRDKLLTQKSAWPDLAGFWTGRFRTHFPKSGRRKVDYSVLSDQHAQISDWRSSVIDGGSQAMRLRHSARAAERIACRNCDRRGVLRVKVIVESGHSSPYPLSLGERCIWFDRALSQVEHRVIRMGQCWRVSKPAVHSNKVPHRPSSFNQTDDGDGPPKFKQFT